MDNCITVTGDRQLGKFIVCLVKRRKDLEAIPEEKLYNAKITKVIEQAYSYKVGDKVVVDTTGKVIDPFAK